MARTTGDAGQWTRLQRKTDRDDARQRARLAAVGPIDPVAVVPHAGRPGKSLIGLRKRRVGERVRSQNRIRGRLVSQGRPTPRGARTWTERGRAGIARFARPLAQCGPQELGRGELHGRLERLRVLAAQTGAGEARRDPLASPDRRVSRLPSLPGVGPRTAEVNAVPRHDARRVRWAEELSASAGLGPRPSQSGPTDRRGRITRRGPKLRRAAWVECAGGRLRSHGWARDTGPRRPANDASQTKAIGAWARRRLVRCGAILRTGEPGREPTAVA
ncbi:MAG TPA: transposase [Gemmataceae bacterium]|nr:transposase [Gemmataceae bacterium]